MTLNPQFVTDKKGRRMAVQLSVKEYEYLVEELEMKEDIALYEKVKVDKNESYIPFKEYLKKRKKNNGCLLSSSFGALTVSDYGVIYEIEDKMLRILVVAIGNRKNIYE